MRIAYFTDTFLPQVNGVATALANQATELAERGHNILIFCPKMDAIKRKKFRAANVKVVYLPTVPALLYPEFKLGIFGLPVIIKHLMKFKPDIIHLHTPLTVGIDGVMAARVFNKPLVGTVHVYFPESGYLKWLKYKLAIHITSKVALRLFKFIFRQCDLILVPSKLLLSELKKEKFTKPISYLPNGIKTAKRKPITDTEKKALQKKYGLKEKVILHFGRLSDEKNVQAVIKSFSIVAKNNPDVSLLIVGDGPAKKKLTFLTKKLGLEKRIIFTGFIEHQELMSSGLLSLADLFITASPMENNPMAVLEAQAHGLPIIAVKQAGLIELISTNGFLIKEGNLKDMARKTEEILYKNDLQKKMSNESLRVVKNYSIESVAGKLLDYYKHSLRSFGSKAKLAS